MSLPPYRPLLSLKKEDMTPFELCILRTIYQAACISFDKERECSFLMDEHGHLISHCVGGFYSTNAYNFRAPWYSRHVIRKHRLGSRCDSRLELVAIHTHPDIFPASEADFGILENRQGHTC